MSSKDFEDFLTEQLAMLKTVVVQEHARFLQRNLGELESERAALAKENAILREQRALGYVEATPAEPQEVERQPHKPFEKHSASLFTYTELETEQKLGFAPPAAQKRSVFFSSPAPSTNQQAEKTCGHSFPTAPPSLSTSAGPATAKNESVAPSLFVKKSSTAPTQEMSPGTALPTATPSLFSADAPAVTKNASAAPSLFSSGAPASSDFSHLFLASSQQRSGNFSAAPEPDPEQASSGMFFQQAGVMSASCGASGIETNEPVETEGGNTEIYRQSVGSSSQLKGMFEQKAKDSQIDTTPRKSWGAAQNSLLLLSGQGTAEPEEGTAEIHRQSAGSASQLKGMFEQKARDSQGDTTPRKSWGAVQNSLPLPSGQGSGTFRAHDQGYKQKASFTKPPPGKKSLSELP